MKISTVVFLITMSSISSIAQNVGIGTIEPLAKLHIENLVPDEPVLRIVDGNQGQGKVLVSDPNGNATWDFPAVMSRLKDSDNDTRIDVEESTDNDEIRFYSEGGLVLRVYKSPQSMPMVEPISPLATYNSFFGVAAGLNTRLGINNSFFGYEAGKTNSTGFENTFVGASSGLKNGEGQSNTFAGAFAGVNNSSGDGNVFLGAKSGFSNISGIENDFHGYNSGYSNVSGDFNVAVGVGSMYSSTDRSNNVAIGSYSLYFNGTNASFPIHATKNTVVGTNAGYRNTNGYNNSFFGFNAGKENTTGSRNTFVGGESGVSNQDGTYNTFVGYFSGYANVSGRSNTFVGRESGANNTSGNDNTFLGGASGLNNNIGINNTMLGNSAGRSNSSGSSNHFIGAEAGYNNTTGSSNIAIGRRALYRSTDKTGNIAIGDSSLYFASGNSPQGGAIYNTAVGFKSGLNSTIGDHNSFFGSFAGLANGAGRNNSYFGFEAGKSGVAAEKNTFMGTYAADECQSCDNNTVLGYASGNDLILGDKNTYIGANSGSRLRGSENLSIGYLSGVGGIIAVSYSNSIALGSRTLISGNNQVRIGNSSITSIGGYAAWSNLSDGRYKVNVRDDAPGLNFIIRLRPVTYQVDYQLLSKNEYADHGEIPEEIQRRAQERMKARQSGFIAQEVEKLVEEIDVVFDGVVKPESESGEYALSYSTFVVPLVKAAQEQQEDINALRNSNNELEVDNKALRERIDILEQQMSKLMKLLIPIGEASGIK